MATIPTTKNLCANGVQILNTIRSSASSTYQERIPVATQENIREIGNAMFKYESTQNEFISALVNRIAAVVVTSKSYSNPLRMFKKGVLDYGETIEEVFVNLCKAHQFDPAVAEKEVFKREIPDVNAVFHKLNLRNFYKNTISNEQLRMAFLSAQGIVDLVEKIINSMYVSAEFDEYLCMKQLIEDAAIDGKLYPVKIPDVSPANAKEIVSIIKGISNQMEFFTSKFNAYGVLNFSKKQDQVLLVDANFDAVIDVEVLAFAFNMTKAEFMGRRVLVDNFGKLTGVVAALVDKDWFMVYDNWTGFTENYNGEGLYWQYFYHIWKTFSTSPFQNAVIFTTDDIAVTNVTVAPPSATVTKGQQVQFTATVTGTGYIGKCVTWSVSGDSDISSTINQDGILTVSANEANTTLTVTATSDYDSSKKGTATVTVQG